MPMLEDWVREPGFHALERLHLQLSITSEWLDSDLAVPNGEGEVERNAGHRLVDLPRSL